MDLAKTPDTIPGMKKDAPPFTHKLARRMENRTAREVAGAADIPEQSIYDWMSRGTVPRASACLKLARALGVPVEWLIDDDAPEQPPRAGENLSDYELMFEIAKRNTALGLEADELLARAEEVNWQKVATELYKTGYGEKGPAGSEIPTLLANQHDSPMVKMHFFELEHFTSMHATKFDITNEQARQISLPKLRKRMAELATRNPMIRWVSYHRSVILMLVHSPDRDLLYNAFCAKALEKIDRGQPPAADPSSPTFFDEILAS